MGRTLAENAGKQTPGITVVVENRTGAGGNIGTDIVAKAAPEVPNKLFYKIGEVSNITGVESYVLRYWEQEFTQLKPVKRSGNRRYYQHHEVLLIRRIRELLYEQGFTISGARNRLMNSAEASVNSGEIQNHAVEPKNGGVAASEPPINVAGLRQEICEIIQLLDA